MPDYTLPLATLVLSLLNLALLAVVLVRAFARDGGGAEAAVREESRAMREESAAAARALREELSGAQKQHADMLHRMISEMGQTQRERLEASAKAIAELKASSETQLTEIRRIVDERLQQLRQSNEERLKEATASVREMTAANDKRLGEVRDTFDRRIEALQKSNEERLEKMRQTVDEKLQATLKERLGESFKMVGDRLEAVQRGLGEMQELANGVGDLKRVLTNVSTRGAWGEVQLQAILEQLLTHEQYEANVEVQKGSRERVEFALRLPGPDDAPEKIVYLPIDSKFPIEDYQRLVDASEAGDAEAAAEATKALMRVVAMQAKKIREKYVAPPATTDFAVMFLPVEGLYAEVLRRPGLVEDLLKRERVVVAGPTTLSAILSSLRLGFRTLAIEKRASEVWEVLSAVKTEFGKFGQFLDKAKRQVQAVSNTLEDSGRRTRAMNRKLKDLETLPGDRAEQILGLDAPGALEDEDDEDDAVD